MRPAQAITKHLNVLLDARVVRRHVDPSDVHYQARVERPREAAASLEAIALHWESRLSRLKAVAEIHPLTFRLLTTAQTNARAPSSWSKLTVSPSPLQLEMLQKLCHESTCRWRRTQVLPGRLAAAQYSAQPIDRLIAPYDRSSFSTIRTS